MILRRFMQHVKEQNWFAVGLDVIVVIVGIFLGMQVQQWYEESELKQQEISYLEALQEDIKRLNEVFDIKIEFEDSRSKLGGYIYGLLEQDDFINKKDEIAAGMLALTNRRTANFSSPVYTDLLSSGKLTLIKDESLRKEIIAFFSALEFNERVLEKNSAQFVDSGFHVFVYKHLKYYNIHKEIPSEVALPADEWGVDRQKQLLKSNVMTKEPQLLAVKADDPLWNEFKREISWRTLSSISDGAFVAAIKERSRLLTEKISTYLRTLRK